MMLTKPSESIRTVKLYSNVCHMTVLHTGNIELVIKLSYQLQLCIIPLYTVCPCNAVYWDCNLFSAGIVADMFHSACLYCLNKSSQVMRIRVVCEICRVAKFYCSWWILRKSKPRDKFLYGENYEYKVSLA